MPKQKIPKQNNNGEGFACLWPPSLLLRIFVEDKLEMPGFNVWRPKPFFAVLPTIYNKSCP